MNAGAQFIVEPLDPAKHRREEFRCESPELTRHSRVMAAELARGPYFGRVVWSCSQATSTSRGTGQVEILYTPIWSGGVVRPSSHFLTSACPSQNEKPQARL